MVSTPDNAARLRRRGFWLEYASMAWMTVEAAVAVTAGVLASSVALIGFGLDSVVDFCAAGIVIWQLRGDGEKRETRGQADRRDLLRACRLSRG
jgi:divalent metal cation (Fe/Co/Zn/Cd) transporter